MPPTTPNDAIREEPRLDLSGVAQLVMLRSEEIKLNVTVPPKQILCPPRNGLLPNARSLGTLTVALQLNHAIQFVQLPPRDASANVHFDCQDHECGPNLLPPA